MKKALSILILVIIFINILPINTIIAAKEEKIVPSEICNAIANELSIYEQTKDFIAMEYVDFNNLDIGEKISVYEYSNNGFSQLSEAYLLFYNKKIVSLAYKVDNLQFQFMTHLANLIYASSEETFALIYDSEGCYLYNGEKFILLCSSHEEINERKKVSAMTFSEIQKIKLSNIKISRKLPYTSTNTRDSTGNYWCNVDYVPQQYSKICWAACVAMVANKINGTSLTALSVALAYFGINFNFDLAFNFVTPFMNSQYNLSYTHDAYAPTDDEIISSFSRGCPVIGEFMSSQGGHAVVIYGVNVLAGRIAIMNPNSGSMTAYYGNGGYQYTSSVNGLVYTLDEGIYNIA